MEDGLVIGGDVKVIQPEIQVRVRAAEYNLLAPLADFKAAVPADDEVRIIRLGGHAEALAGVGDLGKIQAGDLERMIHDRISFLKL